MTEDNEFLIGVVLLVMEVVFIIFISAYVISDSDTKRRKAEYAECKQKTSDIEWCVKKVFGQKLN